MYVYDFGKRRETPCFDCDPNDGHCTMNCGPAAKKVTPEEHAGDFRRALELADKLTQENAVLREKVDMLIRDRDMWRKAALNEHPGL